MPCRESFRRLRGGSPGGGPFPSIGGVHPHFLIRFQAAKGSPRSGIGGVVHPRIIQAQGKKELNSILVGWNHAFLSLSRVGLKVDNPLCMKQT